MLVRATLILLTSVCLATVAVDIASRDVVFTVQLWYDRIEDIVFSWAKFEEFFGCFCGTKHQSCIAEYDSQNGNEVTSVGTAGMNMTNIDDDPRYYQCTVQHWNDKLVCQFQNNAPSCTRNDLKFQAFRVENSSCDSHCIELIWRYEYVNVEITNTNKNVEFFNDSCECPAVTASTTAAVTPVTTTTATTKTAATTTTTTTTANTTPLGTAITETTTISMSTETFSTSTSTATKSGNKSEEDRPLGVIIGVVIAVITIIAFIIVLVALFVRRRTQKQKRSSQREEAITSLGHLNNVRSVGRPQNGVGDINRVYPYAVHTLSSNYYSQIEGSHGCATNNATPRYANVRNGNSAGKAKGDKPSAISQDSCKTAQADFTQNKTKINNSPYSEEHGKKRNNNYVNNNPNLTTTETGKASNLKASKRWPTIKPISESAATGYELAQLVNEDGNDVGKNIAVWDVAKQNNIEANADSGYSAIRNTQNVNEKDRPTKQNMSQISPYEYAGKIEYTEPEYTYDTVTNNKPVQLNNSNSNSNTAITTNNKKGSDTDHSINNTYSLAGDINSSSTQTQADNSTHIYSRLHEENRRPQNPYNTLLEPNEGDTTHTPLSGSAHISRTANQPSCYSFAQPISNEKEDNNIGVKNDAMSQNHTYCVLETSEQQVSDGEEHNCDVKDKQQNIYFELEKQEDISDSDVEA